MEPPFSAVPDSVALVDNHLAGFFDENEIFVLHELNPEVVHSDVFIVKPGYGHDFYLLMSCGMSALPMTVPEGSSYLEYAEVMVLLPADWNLNAESLGDENNYWPIRMLRQLSKYPHQNHTWLGWGHTVMLDTKRPANHPFNSVLLLDSLYLSAEFSLIAGATKPVNVYSLIPLYPRELEFKLKEGLDALMDRFNEYHVDDLLDIHRVDVCDEW